MPESNSINRRRAERREASKAVALVVESGHHEIASHAFAVNLSQLGARVRTPVRLEPGQQVTVIPREGKAYAVPSRVIWVHSAQSGGDTEVGLAFLEAQAPSSSLLAELR
ncbi:MAG: PilZ domain-containing protein [Terriglobia bacterium]